MDVAARAVGGRAPVTTRMLDKLLEDVAVSGERLGHVLGFTPRYDLESGWRDVVARMQHGTSRPPGAPS